MLRRNFSRLCDKSFAEQYASTGSNIKGGPATLKTTLQVSISKTQPGSLMAAIAPFSNRGLSLRNISNRRAPYNEIGHATTMFLDVDALQTDPKFIEALEEVKKTAVHTTVLGSWNTPWFPTHIGELDLLDQSTLAGGAELADDAENPHPGFNDEGYKARRRLIAAAAGTYKHGAKIDPVEYSDAEHKSWTVVWDNLTALHCTHACKQFNHIFPRLVEGAGFTRDKIPQLQGVSEFLQEATGFSLRPVAGLLSSRDFLNALAFRVFFSTQYIRHPSKPLYTPEPDVVHELMGHAPLFADKDFADFSQAVGLASLGCNEEDVEGLARCYWYTVEFGLCLQGGKPRAYGAGLLSSSGELEYSLSDKPKHLAWDPFDAAKRDFPITTYQPTYYVAEDFKDACKKMQDYADALDRPFTLEYNPSTKKVKVFPRQNC